MAEIWVTERMESLQSRAEAERRYACPTCGAPKGDPCLTRAGDVPAWPHMLRMYAFYGYAGYGGER